MDLTRYVPAEITVLDDKAAKGAGTAFVAKGYVHKGLVVATEGMAAGDSVVIKVYASNSDVQPTWVDGSDDPAAATKANRIAPVALKDLDAGTTIAGSTGVTISNSNGVKRYEINDNYGAWFNVLVTTYTDANSSSKVSAFVTLSNN